MSDTGPVTVRPSPCPSCPYRRAVPSGVWHAQEYAKLPRYDGGIGEQANAEAWALFHCHSDPDHLCAGWVGHRDPVELLAVRMGLLSGRVAPAVLDYATDVPLFATGAEAAEHGCRDIDAPDDSAVSTVQKIIRTRDAREARP